MRLTAVFIMLFLAVPVNAEEETSAQANEPTAQGMIYATVQIAEDMKAEFVDGPNSELPADIVAKVSPSLMTKARNAHMAAPTDDGIYRVAIDWKVVSDNGQDQMKFGYSNSDAFPVRKVEPVYSQQNFTTPVEIVYRISVAADGSVTEVNRSAESGGNMDLYRAGRNALKQWEFSPRYKDGIAVATDMDFPLVFELKADEAHGPQMHGL